MSDSPLRPPAITFFLDRVGPRWRVERVKVDVAGRAITDHVRAGGWPSNAAMEPLAATLALFTIKEARTEFPSLRAAEPAERALVERCATLWRNANGTSAKWVNAVFGGLLEPRSAGASALRQLICVHGSKDSRIVSLAEGRLAGQFGFRMGKSAASPAQLQAFVTSQRRPVEGNGAPRAASENGLSPVSEKPGRAKANRAESVRTRVSRENIYRRPCIVLDGPLDAVAEGMGAVVDDLALLLARCEWHVIHGPVGIGMGAVVGAITKHHAGTLTHTLVIGSGAELVSGADVVLVLRGLKNVYIEEPPEGAKWFGRVSPSFALSDPSRSRKASVHVERKRKCFNRTCTSVLVMSWHRGELSTVLWDMLRDIAAADTETRRAVMDLQGAGDKPGRRRSLLRLIRVFYFGKLESQGQPT